MILDQIIIDQIQTNINGERVYVGTIGDGNYFVLDAATQEDRDWIRLQLTTGGMIALYDNAAKDDRWLNGSLCRINFTGERAHFDLENVYLFCSALLRLHESSHVINPTDPRYKGGIPTYAAFCELATRYIMYPYYTGFGHDDIGSVMHEASKWKGIDFPSVPQAVETVQPVIDALLEQAALNEALVSLLKAAGAHRQEQCEKMEHFLDVLKSIAGDSEEQKLHNAELETEEA